MKLLTEACQEALLARRTDHDYEPSHTQGSNEMDDDDLMETTRSQEQPTLS